MYSKGLLVTGIAITVYRDFFTSASNNELSLYLIAIVSAACAIKYVFGED